MQHTGFKAGHRCMCVACWLATAFTCRHKHVCRMQAHKEIDLPAGAALGIWKPQKAGSADLVAAQFIQTLAAMSRVDWCPHRRQHTHQPPDSRPLVRMTHLKPSTAWRCAAAASSFCSVATFLQNSSNTARLSPSLCSSFHLQVVHRETAAQVAGIDGIGTRLSLAI